MRKISSSVQFGSKALCSSLELCKSFPNGFSTWRRRIRELAVAWTDGLRQQATDNDPSDTLIGITMFLQMFGYRDEHTGRKRHVKHAVVLLPPLFEFLQMLSKIHKRFILIVLSRNVTAEVAEVGQLLLHLLGRGLDG